MWNSRNFYEKLLEGWERSETTAGVPYYINHRSEVTQWDHPFLLKTMEELSDHDCVKYAAYRTAMKLRFIQKRLKMDLVSLDTITHVFKRRGHNGPTDSVLDCIELENILLDIMFEAARKDHTRQITAEQSAELLLNWLLNMYDENRSGRLRSLSIKIGLAALCNGRLAEKYRFFFQQICDHNNHVSRKSMAIFLHDLMQIPEVIHESASFGGLNVDASVNSCMERAMSSLGISEDVFLDWMFREPQTLVWLPTMHRMATSESVKHECKCNICKNYPIIGFRYRCLKCFNMDLCQQCFLTGRVTKKHKMTHPTQEYCVTTGSKEDTKAFVKTVKNNLSKKSKEKCKRPRYLPVDGSGNHAYGLAESFHPEAPEPDIHRMLSKAAKKLADHEHLAPPEKVSKMLQTETVGVGSSAMQEEKENAENLLFPQSADIAYDHRQELESIIHHLEDENNELLQEIEKMQNTSFSDSEDSSSDTELVQQRQEKMEVKQNILEDHNRQLEVQLQRLKKLLEQDDMDSKSRPHKILLLPAPRAKQVDINTQLPKPLPPFKSTPKYVSPSQAEAMPSTRPIIPQIARLQAQRQISPNRHITQGAQHQPSAQQSSFYSNSPLHIPLSENRPNVLREQVPLGGQSRNPPFSLNESQRTPNRSERSLLKTPNRTMDQTDLNFSQYPWDNQLSQTDFNLPTPGTSQYFPNEEDELNEIMERLQSSYPANMSYSRNATMPVDHDDIYAAANNIGTAMSNFVGHMTVEN